MSVAEQFLLQCRGAPDSVALRELRPATSNSELQINSRAERQWSWAQLLEYVQATARWLVDECGLSAQSGVHLATWLPNGVDWIAIDLAAQLMGWVHVALDTRLPWASALNLAEHSQSVALLVPAHFHPTDHATIFPKVRVVNLPGDVRTSTSTAADLIALSSSDGRSTMPAERPAQILYTSGTISRPKGVVLTHGNLLSNALAKLIAAPQFSTDVRLNILPFAHAYARTCELSTWILSGSQLTIASDWPEFLHWAPRIEPTLINLVPHLAHKLAASIAPQPSDSQTSCGERGRQLIGSRLRLLQVGGAALSRSAWNVLAQAGWPPLQGYGLTETSPVICSNLAGTQRPDSVGPAVKDVQIRIDSTGVLWTRGPHVMHGYWNDPVRTAVKIVDGWLCTEDLAELGDDGALRILGRIDDQIALSTGYKVQPLEIARRLSEDPWIESLVVVGQNRPYIAALVWPKLAQLPAELFVGGMAPSLQTLDMARWAQSLVARWQPTLSDLPRAMHLEKVALLPKPLTVEDGGLNFKGAVRRKFVEETLYEELVENLYRGSSAV